MINVFYTIPALTKYSWGPTYTTIQLANGLSKNCNTRIYTLDWNSESYKPDLVTKFKMLNFPKKLGFSRDFYKKLCYDAQTNKIDVLHNHGLWMMPNVYPGLIATRYKIPYVVTAHGAFSDWAWNNNKIKKKLFWNFFQKNALKSVSCFIATSYQDFLDIRKRGFLQPIAIIPHGIDIPSLCLKKSNAAKTLLFLGRIHPVKGLENLLYAWSKIYLLHKNWTLNIVGPDSDNYLNDLKKLSKKLALKNIYFKGPLYEEKKIRMIQNSDLFVLPSHSENFAIAIAEAMASSVPVLTTNKTPWLNIEDKMAGWCIEDNADDLACKLDEIMSLPSSELRNFGKNARGWMIKEYSWKIAADKTYQLYGWLLGNSKVPDFVILE